MAHGIADIHVNKRHGKMMKRLPPVGPGGGPGGTGTGGGGGGGGGGGATDPDTETSSPTKGTGPTASAPSNPPPSKPSTSSTKSSTPPPKPTSSSTKAPPPPPTPTSTTPTTSSTTPTTSSTIPTSPPVAPSNTLVAPPATMTYVPPFALTTTDPFSIDASPTDTSPSPSSSDASSGSSTGSIIGIVAAAIAGVVVVGAVASWVIRRKLKRGKRGDGFDQDDFLRNSVMIPDEMTERGAPMGTSNALAIARANTSGPPAPSRTPRPPSTIERHVAASRQHQQAPPLPSMQPGQYTHQDDYFASSYGGYIPPDDHAQTELTRKPSTTQYRGGPGGQYGSPDEYGQGRNLTSVTPYQQEQYAAISRQLDFEHPQDYPPQSNLQRQPSQHAEFGYAYSPEPDHYLPNPHNGPFADGAGVPPAVAGRHLVDQGRSGTPVNSNPQQAYRAPHGGYPQLSNAPHTAPHHGEVGLMQNGNRRHSVVDDDDAYGGI